jgi:Ca2+-binding EF-hand superfamily protein
VDLAEFLTNYDTDADGALSEDEAATALEASRPQGPPPEGMMAGRGAMQGSGPDYAQMFSEADTDGDSSISATEAESLADIISSATGTTIKADDVITAYDADGDGALSAEETATALEANQPAGPPPPPGNMTAAAEGSDAATSAAIDKYLKMAALGMEQGQATEDIFSMLAGTDSSVDSIA